MAWVVTIGGSDVTDDVRRATIITGSREGGEVQLETRGLNPTSFAPVEITRSGVKLFDGRVGPLSTPHDGTDVLEGDLRCEDTVTALRHTLVDGAYSGTVTAVVTALLTEYAPHLALSIETIPVNVSMRYNYLALLEALRGLARAGGAQFTAYDGTFYFFRESWGSLINLPFAGVATPYDYSQDPSELINDVYVIGGASRASHTRSWIGDGVTTDFAYDRQLVNIAVTVDAVAQNLALEGFTAPAGVDALLNPDDRVIKFLAAPGAGTDIVLSAQYDYTVLERLQDPDSIAKYGRLQRIINDTNIMDKATARAMGRNELQSEPREVLRLDLVDFAPVMAGRRLYLPWLDRFGVVTHSTLVLASVDTTRLEVELL